MPRGVPKKLLGKVHKLDFLTMAGKLGNNSVDVIVADPPYGRGFDRQQGVGSRYKAKKGGHTKRLKGDTRPPRDEWASEMHRLVKPAGAVYGFCDENTIDDWIAAYKNAGFKVKNVLVWDKCWGFPGGSREASYGKRVEFILFCVKGKHKLRRGRHGSLISFPRGGDNHPNAMKYPTQKPVELGMFLIEKSCGPKGIVLEPFAGSGFASKAARCLGRKFAGCDIDSTAVRMANKQCSCPVMPEQLKLPTKTVAGPYADQPEIVDKLGELEGVLFRNSWFDPVLYQETWVTEDLEPTEMVRRHPEKVPVMATAFADGWPEDMSALWVDSQGHIIDGHHRWEAAMFAGLPEVPVIVADRDLVKAAVNELGLSRVQAVMLLMEHPVNEGLEAQLPENIVGHPAPVGPVVAGPPVGDFVDILTPRSVAGPKFEPHVDPPIDPRGIGTVYLSEDEETYIEVLYGPADAVAGYFEERDFFELADQLRASESPTAGITGFVVDKGKRRKGVGGQMLQAVLSELDRLGVRSVWVHAVAEPGFTEELPAFYARYGFKGAEADVWPGEVMVRYQSQPGGVGMPPHGFEWHDPEGPPPPTLEQRAKMTGKKNRAAKFQGSEPGLYHGTTRELDGAIRREGLKAQAEWGMGKTGVFLWGDAASAMNWANYWYGDDGMVVEVVEGEAIRELYRDFDPGNSYWAGWVYPRMEKVPGSIFPVSVTSRSYIVPHDLPPEALFIWDYDSYIELMEEHREEAEESSSATLLFGLPAAQFREYEIDPGFARETSGTDMSHAFTDPGVMLPEIYGEWETPPKKHRNDYHGRDVIWYTEMDRPLVRIPADMVLNAFNNTIRNACDKVELLAPMGDVQLVELADVEETQEAKAQGRLDRDYTLEEPWSSGEDEVDAYLGNQEEWLEANYEYYADDLGLAGREDEDDFEEVAKTALKRFMDDWASRLEKEEAGDLGGVYVSLRDGNHRAFGAIQAGEPYVWVLPSDYSDPDALKKIGADVVGGPRSKYKRMKKRLEQPPPRTISDLPELLHPHRPEGVNPFRKMFSGNTQAVWNRIGKELAVLTPQARWVAALIFWDIVVQWVRQSDPERFKDTLTPSESLNRKGKIDTNVFGAIAAVHYRRSTSTRLSTDLAAQSIQNIYFLGAETVGDRSQLISLATQWWDRLRSRLAFQGAVRQRRWGPPKSEMALRRYLERLENGTDTPRDQVPWPWTVVAQETARRAYAILQNFVQRTRKWKSNPGLVWAMGIAEELLGREPWTMYPEGVEKFEQLNTKYAAKAQAAWNKELPPAEAQAAAEALHQIWLVYSPKEPWGETEIVEAVSYWLCATNPKSCRNPMYDMRSVKWSEPPYVNLVKDWWLSVWNELKAIDPNVTLV